MFQFQVAPIFMKTITCRVSSLNECFFLLLHHGGTLSSHMIKEDLFKPFLIGYWSQD